jgi:hypothetical protein
MWGIAGTRFPPPVPLPALQAPPPLFLQLLLQFVEEAPVGALGDDRLRGRLDHPCLVEAQGVEADGILRVVLAPSAIGDLLHGLEGERIGGLEALVHEELGGSVRLESAETGRLENGAHGAFAGHRMLSDELPIPCDHAAEVVGPGPVHAAVQ